MDAIYYISGTLMTITFFGLVIATVFFMIKPHHLNKSKYVNNPVSRQKVFIVGLASIFVVLFGFSSVIAATEPASVKQERIANELSEQKAEQTRLQQEKEAEAKQAQAVEKERLQKIEDAKPVIKTKSKTEIIPFELTEQDDSSIALGEKRISVEGIDGERTITYDVTYINGVETSRKEIKNEVTKQQVTQVTLVGTYVYVAPVQSTPTTDSSQSAPVTTSNVRTGATCNDGSHSDATGSGACSHHHGVAYWLY